MAHELDRIILALAGRPWAIEADAARRIVGALALRHANGPRAEPYADEDVEDGVSVSRANSVGVIRMHGSIVPRASAVRDVSSAFASMEDVQASLMSLADDPKVKSIVLDIDSPGGMVDLVPETAALVREARKPGRPIYAVANTMAASAAYWIASQADALFASPSAVVGSIGVRAMHEDISGALKRQGVKVTHIHAGPRKVEGNPYEPLSSEAKAALQEGVDAAYDAFVAAVAEGRGVKESAVRADPEREAAHMGGGRVLGAQRAVELGMADGVATLAEVLEMAASRSVRSERQRLALI